MSVNYTKEIVTSRDIIKELISDGVKLSDRNKQMIIDKIYDAITSAYNYKSNGCDCGQMWCQTCGN